MNKRRYYATRPKYVAKSQLTYAVSYQEAGQQVSTIISRYVDQPEAKALVLQSHPTAMDIKAELLQSGE